MRPANPPLTFPYTILDFIYATSRIQLNVSGIRTGKSFSGAYKGVELANKYCARGLVVSPTYTMLDELFRTYISILEYYKIPYKERQGAKPRILVRPNTKRQVEILFRSGSDYRKLKGLTIDWCHLDEASIMNYRIFTEVKDRISYAPMLREIFGHGIIFITSTPEGRNWLYDLYLESMTDSGILAFNIHTIDAGIVTPAEVEYSRNTLDPRLFRQNFEGSYEAWIGVVYAEMNDKNITKCEYNPELPVYCGLDFGYTHNSCAIWTQYDKHKGEWYILKDAFIHSQITPKTFFGSVLKGRDVMIGGTLKYKSPVPIERLNAMATMKDFYTAGAFIAGVEVNQHKQEAGGSSMREIARKYGINLEVKSHRVFNSISNVRRFVKDATGTRRLFVEPTGNKKIISDFQSYHYKERNGVLTGEIPVKDGIVDDSMDALRYAIDTVTPLKEMSF